MKIHMLIAAMALVIASPAVAQTAPAQPAQDHAQHGQGHAAHAQHGQPQGGQHDQHQGHDMQSGCCADRNGNGRMDCCENMAEGQSCCPSHGAQPAQPARPQADPNR